MRAIFCMFAQSVGLLPTRTAFSDLLQTCRAELPRSFIIMMGDLWRTMNDGGYSSALHAAVLRFNGWLFRAGVHGAWLTLTMLYNYNVLAAVACGDAAVSG
jgi:hypothetical protein